MSKSSETSKKMRWRVVTVVTLTICLCVTTFALIFSVSSIKDNHYKTGLVKINLNDGVPVIQEYEFNWYPGSTIAKSFFIENDSTWDVYYKIYFADVEGDLGDAMQVVIKDGDNVLYSGTANELTRKNVQVADDSLAVGEKKYLMAYFTCPDDAAMYIDDMQMTFSLCADAVQTKNNPDKLFE